MEILAKCCRLLATALVGTVLTGCASISFSSDVDDPQRVNAFNDLVSRDVVSVLSQIAELAPATTVLGISNDAWQPGEFANALKDELESVGYAIRSVGIGSDTLSMGYSLIEEVATGRHGQTIEAQTVTVMAGDIGLRRSYEVTPDGEVRPLGRMQVKGIDPGKLYSRGEIFAKPEKAGDEQNARPAKPRGSLAFPEQSVEYAEPATVLAETPITEQSVVTDQSLSRDAGLPLPQIEQVDQANTLPTLVVPSSAAISIQLPPDLLDSGQRKPTENILELQQSNFEDVYADMGLVREKILTFADDSTRMSNSNKLRLRDLVDRFNPDSDLISVVGCALGKTNYSGGQKELAIGRAMSVRDELVEAGIPSERILEEGCWSEEPLDLRMPRRGVVIALKRRVG